MTSGIKHREFDGLTGRQIIESFGNLNHDYIFHKIRDLPSRVLIGRESVFSACSSVPEANWLFDKCVKELEDKKLPYRVIRRLEWFVPKEESDVKRDNKDG